MTKQSFLWNRCCNLLNSITIYISEASFIKHIANILIFLKLFSLCSQRKWGYKGSNSRNACWNSKQGKPTSDCFFRSSLIWVCTVCLWLLIRQLVFKIVEIFTVHSTNCRLKSKVMSYNPSKMKRHTTKVWLCPICDMRQHWVTIAEFSIPWFPLIPFIDIIYVLFSQKHDSTSQ